MEFTDDDEGDLPVPGVVTEYRFVDEKDEPVCFSSLPLQRNEDATIDIPKEDMFIHGDIDDGLQKFYTQVVAWNVEFIDDGPQVRILTKDRKWLKIKKPRKSYQDTIRSILIALESLFYLKRNPSSSEKSLWDHVRKAFSQFEVSPCKDDIMVHQELTRTISERDDALSKTAVLTKILQSSSKKRLSSLKKCSEDSSSGGVDDEQTVQSLNDGSISDNDDDDDDHDHDDHDDNDDDSEDDDGHDHVCAICDNGGDLLCCEGECLRSFHATKDAGADSQCRTLGYTRAQVKAIKNFFCPNCQQKKHQCFVCGQLGNSDKQSVPEVFCCMSATCGHFYHPGCIVELLNPENDSEAAALEAKITAGETFLCPVHRCRTCKQLEDKKVEDLQFAICRRCPKAYHRKCLPRKIAFEELEDEGIEQRAWDDLIPNRILIYCLKHKIDADIGTPIRNHVIFPGVMESKTITSPDSKRKRALTKKKAEVSPSEKEKSKKLERSNVETDEYGPSKRLKGFASSGTISKSSLEKKISLKEDKVSSALENGLQLSDLTPNDNLDNEAKDALPSVEEPDAEKRKQKVDDSIGAPERNNGFFPGAKESKHGTSSVSKKKKVLAKRKTEVSSSEKEKKPKKLKKRHFTVDSDDCTTSRQLLHSSKGLKDPATLETNSKDFGKMSSLVKKPFLKDVSPSLGTGSVEGVACSVDEHDNPVLLIDEDTRKRILLLVKKSPSSSLKVKDLLKKKRFGARYMYGVKNLQNIITKGKVEASVEAIRAALQKIENGGSIEDAKAVCGPDILNQITIWKKNMRAYLGPLFHEGRDSSYQSHFKESRKLEETVGRLHWYVNDKDMIVDVCCGAKDFSRLMKKKLVSTGKKCSFKSYDIFPPRSDFNHERRDWTAVQANELEQGSQLVILLDLPHGVSAGLAHKLINKALIFKPKLLAVLSSREIERLGAQPEGYDLIWEEEKLVGQRYRPRTVEGSDNQIVDRNPRQIFLYLWSRPDWSAEHRVLAIRCGHSYGPDKDYFGAEEQQRDHNLADQATKFDAEDDRLKVEVSVPGQREKQCEKPLKRSSEETEKYLLPSHLGDSDAMLESPKINSHRGKAGERNKEGYRGAQDSGEDVRLGERCSRGLLETVHPHHQDGPERSPSPDEKEKQGEITKMKYHWTCLYAQEDQPGERTSTGRVEISSATHNQAGPDAHYVSPNSSNRENPGEITNMRYKWSDLYPPGAQPEERENCSLLPHRQAGPQTLEEHYYRATVDPGETDGQTWITSNFCREDNESTRRMYETPNQTSPSHYRLFFGPMENIPSHREREPQVLPNQELPHHRHRHEFSNFEMNSRYIYNAQHELGQRGSSYSSPSYGSMVANSYNTNNYWSTQSVDQPMRVGDARMWETQEQAGPSHLLSRESKRGMFDFDHFRY